jgi:hypothetical protein
MAKRKTDDYDYGDDDVAVEASAVEDVVGTSSDAAYATYVRVDQQREGDINPPPGQQTQQTRGVAVEVTD